LILLAAVNSVARSLVIPIMKDMADGVLMCDSCDLTWHFPFGYAAV
jgi:hypothetical protein